MLSYDIVNKAEQGELKIQDITVSDLQELVLHEDTKRYGLSIIRQACIDAIHCSLIEKMDALNIHDKKNQELMQEFEDIVYIKNGRVTVNYDTVAKHFLSYLSYYFEVDMQKSIPENPYKVRVNWGNVVRGMRHMPSNIKAIKFANKVNKQVDYMNEKYLGNGEYSLPCMIRKGVENIVKEVDSKEEFFSSLKRVEQQEGGVEKFFSTIIRTETQLPHFFDEYAKDATKLKVYMKQQQKHIEKRRRR